VLPTVSVGVVSNQLHFITIVMKCNWLNDALFCCKIIKYLRDGVVVYKLYLL